MNNKKTYLITGGCRSGKSRYALSLAENAEKPFYIATGWADDKEMEERIRRHRAERGEHWNTIETRTDLTGAIRSAVSQGADFIIVDCLTLWLTNIMFDDSLCLEDMKKELVDFIPEITVLTVFVTNEVGAGIVPENKLARQFRDEAGFLNQDVAAAVDSVVMTVSGLPLKLK